MSLPGCSVRVVQAAAVRSGPNFTSIFDFEFIKAILLRLMQSKWLIHQHVFPIYSLKSILYYIHYGATFELVV